VQTNLEIVRREQARNGANGEIKLYDFYCFFFSL
jgi:hypothetical protein